MKRFFFALALLSSSFAEAGFLNLQPDSPQYQSGDRAVILASVNHHSENPNQDVWVTYLLDGEEVDFLRVSFNQFLGFPRLTSPGNKSVVVQAYLQNQTQVEQTEEKIALLDADLQFFLRRKEIEKDPENLEQIEKSIQDLQGKIAALKEILHHERALLEVKLLPVPVSPTTGQATPPIGQAISPLAVFDLLAESPTVPVGERAKFIATPNTNFYAPDGYYELVWRSTFLGGTIPARSVGNTFEFLSAPLQTSHLGNQTFSLSLDLRAKKQGDFLRTALAQLQKRIRLYEERSRSENRKVYWQWKIAQLLEGKALLQQRLNDTIPVATNSIQITVVPGAK